MKTESLIARKLNSKESCLQNVSNYWFNLPNLIRKMKSNHTWAEGELNSMILLKSPSKKIMLTTLHEGTEIESFQSNDSITFQIIEGKLELYIGYESVTLDKDQFLTLHENVSYKLTTMKETVLLIIIEGLTLNALDNNNNHYQKQGYGK
jgi:mannose-6-phosphate isomerase-like protein (cupin superfamily)